MIEIFLCIDNMFNIISYLKIISWKCYRDCVSNGQSGYFNFGRYLTNVVVLSANWSGLMTFYKEPQKIVKDVKSHDLSG